MLRQTILIKIKEVIDNDSNFSSSDFSFQTEYKTLKITYEFDNSYYFKMDIPSEISQLSRTEKETSNFGMVTKHKAYEYEQYEFSGTISPGQVAIEEKIKFESQENIYKYIKNWLENLWVEITNQPQIRKIKELEEQIIGVKAKFDHVNEDFFTRDEADSLKERLDTLEKRFKEKLEIEIEDKELLIQTLDELHKELEKLKKQTTILNKKNWFKSFGVKMFTWVTKEENRKFLKDSKDFIKPLLPDSVEKFF